MPSSSQEVAVLSIFSIALVVLGVIAFNPDLKVPVSVAWQIIAAGLGMAALLVRKVLR